MFMKKWVGSHQQQYKCNLAIQFFSSKNVLNAKLQYLKQKAVKIIEQWNIIDLDRKYSHWY